MTIRAISLWQPWASLIAVGVKVHETRGFRAPPHIVGQRVAIHATIRPFTLADIDERLAHLCVNVFGEYCPKTLPYGAVVATALLQSSTPMTSCAPVDDNDAICGNWSPDRFAWRMAEVHPLLAPIPAKGMQGWWYWTPPEAWTPQALNSAGVA
jgi:hypothetical protein